MTSWWLQSWLAVNSYGRSWGSSRADAINMRVYTCVKGGVVRLRMRVSKVYGAKIVVGSKMKNEWNKWKNHYYEMKGDVGLSLHEKERNKMPTPRHKVTHNPIPMVYLISQ